MSQCGPCAPRFNSDPASPPPAILNIETGKPSQTGDVWFWEITFIQMNCYPTLQIVRIKSNGRKKDVGLYRLRR
jgi:hypothetical protein